MCAQLTLSPRSDFGSKERVYFKFNGQFLKVFIVSTLLKHHSFGAQWVNAIVKFKIVGMDKTITSIVCKTTAHLQCK